MSVLTVTGSAALPDHGLPVDYPPAASFSTRSYLPTRGDSTDTHSYTRSAALNAQPGIPTSHRHSRTISSAILPTNPFPSHPSPAPVRPPQQVSGAYNTQTHSRHSSTGTINMHRQGTTGSATSVPRRSTSSRSTNTNSPTSYVALMRKQKATVWCDRSQNLDPRLAQAQRAAKQRANLEVTGAGMNSARTSTISSGGVKGKILHNGVPKAPGYSKGNLTGAGVPMRLSANEALGDDEDARSYGDNNMIHGRSGSGKSSASSTNYRSGYPRQDQARFSGMSTPPGGDNPSPGREGIPVITEAQQEKADSTSTSKPTEDESSFGGVSQMQAPSALKQAMADNKTADYLRRSGSVDERASSMVGAVRLYIANPDLD